MNFRKIVLHFLVLTFLLSGLVEISVAQSYGYRSDNQLLPDRLVVYDHVPFDTIYVQPLVPAFVDSGVGPYFNMIKQIDLIGMLAKKAVNKQVTVYDPDQMEDFGPLTGLTPLNDSLIRYRLGERSVTLMVQKGNDFVEETRTIEMDLGQLTSVYSIEDWTFTTSPLRFEKKVIAYEPIRRYSTDDDEAEFRFMKTMLFINPLVDKNPAMQKVANVQYEYVFNQPRSFMMKGFSSQMINSLNGENQNYDVICAGYNSPFFNTPNQRNFIKTLINQVIDGKATSYDAVSNKLLTASEAKNRVITYDTVSVYDEYGEMKERLIEHNWTEQVLSVVFIEDWFLDQNTMQLEKKVVGIAPVCYYFDRKFVEYDRLCRDILFVVKMEN